MRSIGVLIVMMMLLCGCTARQAEIPFPTQSLSQPAEAVSLYSPDSQLERISGGAVRVYPLNGDCFTGIYAMGEDILLISDSDGETELTRLSGETLSISATARLYVSPEAVSCGLQVYPEGLSFFDPDRQQSVLLDAALRERLRLDTPAAAVGTPLLSRDGSKLYYCTDAGVYCLELADGISRLLHRDDLPGKTLAGLLLDETVLQLCFPDPLLGEQQLFLSTLTGQQLYTWNGSLTVLTENSRHYAAIPSGNGYDWVWGSPDAENRMLLTDGAEELVFLPQSHAAVTICRDAGTEAVTLCFCSLDTGRVISRLCCPGASAPTQLISTGNGIVYFLIYDEAYGCQVLCRWDTAALPTGSEACRAVPYHSADDPDRAELEALEALARTIGEPYGIHIAIWKDAVAHAPRDYTLEPEHQVYPIREALEALASQLERYPPEVLKTAAGNWSRLTICLVRSIQGSVLAPELGAADGIRFWEGDDAYIVLAMGENREQALYRNLYHILEIQIFAASGVLDNWNALNPRDFEYDYDYLANRSRDGSRFLQETSRSFVDSLAMSFPTEDRARILEYAMTEGNQPLFDAPILQQKLRTLCRGLREAYALENHPHPLPWEQYLHTPLSFS